MNRALQVIKLAEEAIDLPLHEVDAFLDGRCAGDRSLHDEVKSLLIATQNASQLFPEETQVLPRGNARLLPGEVLLRRFRVVEGIGVGGMGEVYRARDLSLGRDVAIKVIKADLFGDSTIHQRFIREMQSVAALSDPHIAAIYDFSNDGDLQFAVMEFVEGTNLRQLINTGLDCRQALEIIHDIASGLSAAHRVQLMHRDMKPENVMVATDGRARVLDFGLARPESSSLDQQITAEAALAGTIPYMSPEQAQARKLTCATDVFSLGTIAFEMLTGTHPFRADSAVMTARNIVEGRLPDLENVATGLPHDVLRLVLSMLRISAEERPSAKQIAIDCERLSRLCDSTADENLALHRGEDQVLRMLLEGISDAVGKPFFRALVKSLAQALGTSCAMVTEFDRQQRRARAIACWTADGWLDGYEYTIAETPCESVFEQQELYHYPDNLQGLFPADHDLPEMGFMSYMGVPLFDTDGSVLGNLAVLDHKPMPPQPRCIGLLRMFAARAAAEHRRLKREVELREREQYLSQLVKQGVSTQSETSPNNIASVDHQNQHEVKRKIMDLQAEMLLGQCPEMVTIREKAALVAATDAPVLIVGECGTGKDTLARLIHSTSLRNQQSMVHVNLATIEPEKIERELFGDGDTFAGGVAQAEAGTLLINEITNLPRDLQERLLRLLDTGVYEDGKAASPKQANIRVIAMTSTNLQEKLAEGQILESFSERLSVFPMAIPPLRQRGRDILLLAEAFARQFDQTMHRGFRGLTEHCEQCLLDYHWPRNVRELKNVIERAMISATQGQLDLDSAIGNRDLTVSIARSLQDRGSSLGFVKTSELCEIERRGILRALKVCQGKIHGADGSAKLLGIDPAELESKIQELGISVHPG